MKKGDEVAVSFTGRLMRKPSKDGSVQVSINYLNHSGTFVAVVPDYTCIVLESVEDG